MGASYFNGSFDGDFDGDFGVRRNFAYFAYFAYLFSPPLLRSVSLHILRPLLAKFE